MRAAAGALHRAMSGSDARVPDDQSPPGLEDVRRSLRTSIRRLRRGLPPAERARAAHSVARIADQELRLHRDSRLALYASTPEELDTSELIALAQKRGCRVYLPRIHGHRLARAMHFAASGERQRFNRFGIPEPHGAPWMSARALDIVFVPLVAFDRRGIRLGMGGGYYDRALAFRRTRTIWHAPLLVGLGYALQEVERIAPAAHDVPLDLVITERGVIHCSRASAAAGGRAGGT